MSRPRPPTATKRVRGDNSTSNTAERPESNVFGNFSHHEQPPSTSQPFGCWNFNGLARPGFHTTNNDLQTSNRTSNLFLSSASRPPFSFGDGNGSAEHQSRAPGSSDPLQSSAFRPPFSFANGSGSTGRQSWIPRSFDPLQSPGSHRNESSPLEDRGLFEEPDNNSCPGGPRLVERLFPAPPHGTTYAATHLRRPITGAQDLESNPFLTQQMAELERLKGRNRPDYLVRWLLDNKIPLDTTIYVRPEKMKKIKKAYKNGTTPPPPTLLNLNHHINPIRPPTNAKGNVFGYTAQGNTNETAPEISAASRAPVAATPSSSSSESAESDINDTTTAGGQNIRISGNADNMTININGTIISGVTVRSGQDIFIYQPHGAKS